MSTVEYVYSGVLTRDVADWIMSMLQKYPFAIEITNMPKLEEFDSLYSDLDWVSYGEDCMGQGTQNKQKGVPYGFIRKGDFNTTAGFIFLPTEESYKRFVNQFHFLVVNASPFTTRFK